MQPHLQAFAHIAESSREYQGHGWGCAWLAGGEWQTYHNIQPVWQDSFSHFGETTLLLAHARSAFQDKDIRVENNMPFSDGTYQFIFNGELRGVTIRADGRIGAEKIFNFIRRFDKGDMAAAVRKAVPIISRKSRYVRAMNIIIADKQRVYLASQFSEDPDYFTMHTKTSDGRLIICSEAYPGEQDWQPIANQTIQVFP